MNERAVPFALHLRWLTLVLLIILLAADFPQVRLHGEICDKSPLRALTIAATDAKRSRAFSSSPVGWVERRYSPTM